MVHPKEKEQATKSEMEDYDKYSLKSHSMEIRGLCEISSAGSGWWYDMSKAQMAGDDRGLIAAISFIWEF